MIRSLRTDLKADIGQVETRLGNEIKAARTELREDIQAVRSELTAKIDSLNIELIGKIDKLSAAQHGPDLAHGGRRRSGNGSVRSHCRPRRGLKCSQPQTNSKYLIIQLGEGALSGLEQAKWQLAHECVHLLDPHNPTTEPTSNLEEGIAAWFQDTTRWCECPLSSRPP